jgi:hypothetical protein
MKEISIYLNRKHRAKLRWPRGRKEKEKNENGEIESP